MANELSILEQTGSTTTADTDYAGNAAESVGNRFAELEVAAPAMEAATAAAPAPEAKTPSTPTPNRTLPLSATQKALLDAIADVESGGKWNVIVGGKTFNSFDDHPRVVGVKTKYGPSTAAGRYQIVESTYNDVAKKLGVKGFSPDVQDVIALHLAEESYKRATGRDIYKDLENGKAENVRKILGGSGAATVWQGLQDDDGFSNRFSTYKQKYSGASGQGDKGWHPPLAPKAPKGSQPADSPTSDADQPPQITPTKPAPADVTNGIAPKDTEVDKVAAKVDDGLSNIDPNSLPADLRAKYEEIKGYRAVVNERVTEIQNKASARVNELQPGFEETPEFKEAYAKYETAVNELTSGILKNVVETSDGYLSLKYRLEHQLRNNMISQEYANEQLNDYIRKSIGNRPEYTDAKKKLDDDFNTGYKTLIDTYIQNDPVYKDLTTELEDIQNKANEQGAVFGQDWDKIADGYNKAAQSLSCGPDIPEEECQSNKPIYSKTTPSSFDIEEQIKRVTSPSGAQAAIMMSSQLKEEILEPLLPKKHEALRREFNDLSPVAFGLQYITDADSKRREWGDDNRGNFEVENQALDIYLQKLDESGKYVTGQLKSKYGKRYEDLLKELDTVSKLKNSDSEFLNKAKDVNKKYEDILQDKDFQYVFKQVPQYQNRAIETHGKITEKYKQTDRVRKIKEEKDLANKTPWLSAAKALVAKVAGGIGSEFATVIEQAGKEIASGRITGINATSTFIGNSIKEVGETLRVKASDLRATPLAEKMQGQILERSSKTKDGYSIVWEGDSNEVAYIKNPDGTFFSGTEEQRNKLIQSVKGQKREFNINPLSGVGQAVETASYMASIMGAAGAAYLTRGSSLAQAASFLTSYSLIQNSAYEEALKDPSLSVDDALLISNALGASSAVIEMFNPIETAIFSKKLTSEFVRSSSAKYASGAAGYGDLIWEGAKNFTKQGLKELAVEEFPQLLTEVSLKRFANSTFDANYKNLDITTEQLFDLAVMSIGIGGIVPAVGVMARGRSGLGKTALQSIVSNPSVYQEYMTSLESLNPELASKYRSAIDPILNEVNSIQDLAPNKRAKMADILYDIRAIDSEINNTTTAVVKQRKLAEKAKLEDKLNKLLEKPGDDIGADRTRRDAIDALDNSINANRQTTEDNVQEIERLNNEVAGQEMTNRIEFLESRMDSTDYIDKTEIDDAVNDLYNLWDRVDSMEDMTEDQKQSTKAAIENKIQKLEQYEFSTTTQAGETTTRATVKGVRIIGRTARETPSKFQVTTERIASQGTTTVTRADGTTANGTFVLNDDGTIDVVIADGRTVDPRTGTVGIANIPIDSNFIEFVETQKDADGTVTGATIYDAKNNVSYTITDPELALDMAVRAKTASLGPITDAQFEAVMEQFETRTTGPKTVMADGTEVTLSELNKRANQVASEIRGIEEQLKGVMSKSQRTKLKRELAKLKKERDAIQKQKTGKKAVRNKPAAGRKVDKEVQAESEEPTRAGTAKPGEDGPKEESGEVTAETSIILDSRGSDMSTDLDDNFKNSNLYKQLPEGLKRAVDGAVAALKAIGYGIPIHFYTNEEAFLDAINRLHRPNPDGSPRYDSRTNGLFSYDPVSGIGRIDINLSNLDSYYAIMTAAKAVTHEAAHAILFKKFGENPKLFKEFQKKIHNALSGSFLDREIVLVSEDVTADNAYTTIKNYLNNFIKNYDANDSAEEWIVEFSGLLSVLREAGVAFPVLKPSFWDKVASIFNETVKKLSGGKINLGIVNTKDTLDFFNGMLNTLNGYTYEGQDGFNGHVESLKRSADLINQSIKGTIYEPTSLPLHGTGKPSLTATGRKANKKAIETDTEIIEPTEVNKNTLIGSDKTWSSTMSDHTKVGSYNNPKTGIKVDGMMGGVMFMFLKKMREAGIGWASTTPAKARALYQHAIGVSHTLVYRMNRDSGSLGNLDFADVVFAELRNVYNKLAPDAQSEFMLELTNRLVASPKGRAFLDNNEKVFGVSYEKIVKIKKDGTPARNKKGEVEHTFIRKDGVIKSFEDFENLLNNRKTTFAIRGGIWPSLLVKAKPVSKFHTILDKNGMPKLPEFVNNTAEQVTDAAQDGDIVAAIKIAEPEYTEDGTMIVYTPFKELVNKKKGVYYIDAPQHKSYPYYVKGEPIGILNEFNSVLEYYPYIKELMDKPKGLTHPYKAIETKQAELRKAFRPIEKLTPTNRTPDAKYVQDAIAEYEKSKDPNLKPLLKGKASVAVFDNTGFVSVDFWVDKLKDRTGYLDAVLESIISSRTALQEGNVPAEKIVKAYLITLASMGSQGGGYDSWSKKQGRSLADIFTERVFSKKGKEKVVVRPEGVAAAYLSTLDGEKLVNDIVNNTATKEQVRKLFEYVGFGRESQKSGYVMSTMKADGINKMRELFLANRGTDFDELYKGAIKNFSGIGEGKTGFFNQYFGVASRGVVDAREYNAWIAGSMKLTAEQRKKAKDLLKDSNFTQQLLDRIYEVGVRLGYDPEVAGYLAHHGIWDAVKDSITTHAGEYAVISNGYIPGSMMTLPSSEDWQLSMSESEIEEASEGTYVESQGVEATDSKFTKAKREYAADLYDMWGKWFSSTFTNLKDMSILDIGSGFGFVHSKFAPRKKLNVSSSEPMYDAEAFKKASGLETPTFTRADGSDIPTGAFDITLNSGSLSEYPADVREGVLRTAVRALKEGGVAVVNVMSTDYTKFLKSIIKNDPTQGKVLSDTEVLINEGGKLTYVKGYTQNEFESYVKDVLGPNYTVITAPDGVKSMVTVAIEKSPDISGLRAKASTALSSVEDTTEALRDVYPTDNYIKSEKRYRAYEKANLIWHAGTSKINKFDESKIAGGSRGELGYGFYFSQSSKSSDYGNVISFVDSSSLNLLDGDNELPATLVKKLKQYVSDINKNTEASGAQQQAALYAERVVDAFEKKTERSFTDIRNAVNSTFRFDADYIMSKLMTEAGYDGAQVEGKWQLVLYPQDKLDGLIVDPNKATSEAYHKAKEDGSNPELVKAVEDLLTNPQLSAKSSKAPSLTPRPDQLNVMETSGPAYLDNMTDDGNGNYIFYHVSTTDLSNDFIDPARFGANIRTGRDERPGVNISMFYTEPNKADVAGDFVHVVRVPKNMVYPFNMDPLNFYDEAYRRFREIYPVGAFDPNKQVGFISQVAAENGYPMVVAKWGGVTPLRAQSTVKLKPELLKDKGNVYLPDVAGLSKGTNQIKSKESRVNLDAIKKPEFESNVLPQVDRIKALPVNSVDGATFNLDGSTYTGGGLVVPVGSRNTTQNALSSAAVYNFMMKNKDNISSPIFKMGLFKFPSSTTVSIDLNILIPREFREQGLLFGRLAGQKSLFDMDLMEEVDTGATGENPVTYTAEEYAEIASKLAQGQVPDFVYTKAGEPVPVRTNTATSRLKSKASALGKNGVAKLDRAVEEGTIVRFLGAAKNMEKKFGIQAEDWLKTYAEGSSIKRILDKIKLFTGFERGADLKWRYEVSDKTAKLVGEGRLRKDFRGPSLGVKLGDILEHDTLYKAYPKLKDVEVSMFDGADFGFDAAYQRETNTISVSSDLSGSILKMRILHEIQHYIQAREGFDTIGAAEMKNLMPNTIWRLGLNLEGYDTFQEAFNEALDAINQLLLEGKSVLNIYNEDYTKFFFGENPSKLVKYVVDTNNEYNFTYLLLAAMPLLQQQWYFNSTLLPQLEDLSQSIKDSQNELYWNNISEVEARNIERRMDMSAEELRMSLMSDTEDMARSEQIAKEGAISELYDSISTLPSTETIRRETLTTVESNVKKNPSGFLSGILAAAVNSGVKTLNMKNKGGLSTSKFNALINGLVKYIKAQVRNASERGESYKLLDFIDEVRSASSINIDITTSTDLFTEAGVTDASADPKVEEDVIRQSLIDAGFPRQMAAELAKGDTLYEYAAARQLSKKVC